MTGLEKEILELEAKAKAMDIEVNFDEDAYIHVNRGLNYNPSNEQQLLDFEEDKLLRKYAALIMALNPKK